MKWLILGALLGLAWVLAPAVVVAVATNSLVLAFGAGLALRPAVSRRWRGWTA